MLNPGTISGLAVPLQFDEKINDLRYRDDALRRNKIAAESKAKMFADDMDYQNAMNSHDNPIVKNFAHGVLLQTAKFYRDNPDVLTNPIKRTQLKEITRQLKDNPDLIRGLSSDSEYKKFLSDMAEVAKNPQQHDTEAYKNVQNEWNNYLQYGNQGGAEAAKAQGKQAFLYNKPRDFVDLNKSFQDTGNSFKDLKTRDIKGGRNAYEEFADPKSLRIVANQMYAQNKRQVDLEASKQGLDPITYLENGINAHIPKKRDFGDYNLSDAMALQNHKAGLGTMLTNPDSAFQQSFAGVQEGTVPAEFLDQTYGTTPKAIIYDNKGQNKIDVTGNRIYNTGYHKYIEVKDRNGKPHRQKLVETYMYLSPKEAEEKGIYADPWYGSPEIVPEWNKQAEIETFQNKKGEDDKRIKVKSFRPVEMNAANAGAFNQQAHIAKSKLMSQSPEEGGNVPTGTADEFKASGWSDSQIQEGVNSGKIRVH